VVTGRQLLYIWLLQVSCLRQQRQRLWTPRGTLKGPSACRRLHAAPAGSAASPFVDFLIVALSSSAAQGSCIRSPGPSAACFVQAGGAATTSETGGRQLRVRELLGAAGCPWPHPTERHAAGCHDVRHSSEDQFRSLLHSLLLIPRHDIRQTAVVAEVHQRRRITGLPAAAES